MRQLKKKAVLLAIIAALMTSMLACSNAKDTSTESAAPTVSESVDSKQVVMTVEGTDVLLEEAMIYLLSSKEEVETLYGDEIWDYTVDIEGTTYADLFKQQLLEKIKYIKIVCSKAEALDITLSEDEMLDVDEYTADFLSQVSEADIKKYGIQKDVVKQIYSDNVLANKIFESLTLNVDTDVSSEEARQVVLQYIFLSKTGYDESGNEIAYSEEELNAVKEKAQDLSEQAKETQDFYSLAEENSDNSDEIEIVAGKGDLDDALEKVAFSMKTGETSAVIETESGYFILYCKNEMDEEATAEAKEAIIEKRQEEAFTSQYISWETQAAVDIQDDVWAAVSVKNQE
ncbi:MAG: hypothetical protein E7256_05490 [Lachnospiraceae bacterium]|nr:hypothetical protein [Lachnospiraceae bacterium]